MVDNGQEMLDLWKTKLEWLDCREAFFDHIEILWKVYREYTVTANGTALFLKSEYGS